ncbi:hypothetical protein ACRAWD_31265 [Caulobacter segnis]
MFQYTANAGNPDLKPTRSTQYDLELYEWYCAPTGEPDAATVFSQGHLQSSSPTWLAEPPTFTEHRGDAPAPFRPDPAVHRRRTATIGKASRPPSAQWQGTTTSCRAC